MNELAIEWIERYEMIERPDQHEYRVMAQAYIVLGDLETAIRNHVEPPKESNHA